MKLLLDENLPQPLRHELIGHDVYTVGYMNFAGLKNGRLLARAAAEGFDALITQDGNLHHQQNTNALPLAIVVLHARSNDLETLLPLVPGVLRALETIQPNTVAHVS